MNHCLNSSCTLSKKNGKKDVWVDVQDDLDFGTYGQWFWAVQSAPDVNMGDWRNPDNLFGTNCLTYQVTPPVSPDVSARWSRTAPSVRRSDRLDDDGLSVTST